MLDPYHLTLVGVFTACLFASGFLSGSETALTAIPRERVAQLATEGRRGERLAGLVDDLEGSIGVLLVANNFVNILATTSAAALAIYLVGDRLGAILSTILVTIAVLIIGEVTPKTLAARYPERYGMAVAIPVWALKVVLRPIAQVFIGLGQGIIRLFRLTPMSSTGITPADVRALAELGERGGEIEPTERKIIERLFETGDQPVREVMTPRMEIMFLTLPVSAADVRETVARTGHSRFPVVADERNPESVRGILYAKDVLGRALEPSSHQIAKLLRRPYYAPESASVRRVMEDLRENRIGLAIVTDEHGGVDGLVTIKDLVGELVGDLWDEHDPGVPSIRPAGTRVWEADGRTPIDELEVLTGLAVPDGPYSTIAGMLLSLFGRIPKTGDHVTYDGFRFTVLGMDERRIAKVGVKVSEVRPAIPRPSRPGP